MRHITTITLAKAQEDDQDGLGNLPEVLQIVFAFVLEVIDQKGKDGEPA